MSNIRNRFRKDRVFVDLDRPDRNYIGSPKTIGPATPINIQDKFTLSIVCGNSKMMSFKTDDLSNEKTEKFLRNLLTPDTENFNKIIKKELPDEVLPMLVHHTMESILKEKFNGMEDIEYSCNSTKEFFALFVTNTRHNVTFESVYYYNSNNYGNRKMIEFDIYRIQLFFEKYGKYDRYIYTCPPIDLRYIMTVIYPSAVFKTNQRTYIYMTNCPEDALIKFSVFVGLNGLVPRKDKDKKESKLEAVKNYVKKIFSISK